MTTFNQTVSATQVQTPLFKRAVSKLVAVVTQTQTPSLPSSGHVHPKTLSVTQVQV